MTETVYGHTEPRIYTRPLRELTPETSAGFKVITLAEAFGFRLYPWQRWFLVHALELLPDGQPRFRTILLLIARQNGKSTIAALIILWWLCVRKRRTIVGAAQDLATAEEIWASVVEMLESTPDLKKMMLGKPVKTNGKYQVTLTDGSRYLPKAASDGAGRGLSVDRLYFDELRQQRDWKAWAALSKTTMAKRGAQILLTSNAGDDNSIVLNHFQEQGQGSVHDPDTSVFLAEYSADPSLAIDDVEGWRQANPSLGYGIDLSAIKSALSTDPPGTFRTEVLCQRVRRMETVVDTTAWAELADPEGTLGTSRARIRAAIDVTPSGDRVDLAASDGMRVELLRSWVGADAVDRALADLPAIVKALRPISLSYIGAGPTAVLKPALSVLRGTRKVAVRAGDVPAVCGMFVQRVSSRALRHGGQNVLDGQILNLKKQPRGDGFVFVRRDPSAPVSAVYAAAMALYAASADRAREANR